MSDQQPTTQSLFASNLIQWQTTAAGIMIGDSAAWCAHTGQTVREAAGFGWLEAIHPTDRVTMRDAMPGQRAIIIDVKKRAADYTPMQVRRAAIHGRDGHLASWSYAATEVALEDLGERQAMIERLTDQTSALAQAHEQMMAILDSISDAFYALDSEWRFTFVNAEAQRLLFPANDDPIGKQCWDVFKSGPDSPEYHEFRRALSDHTAVTFEEYDAAHELWHEVRAYPAEDGLSVYVHDITARKQMEAAMQRNLAEAQHRALYDPLTDLHNHRAMHDVLREGLATHAAQGLPLSIIMLDIDHFRRFNELYGHDAGDRVLRGVANSIRASLRHDDMAARYGGEEFVIVLPATDADRAHTIALELRNMIAQTPPPVGVSGDPMNNITASFGHATFPVHASAVSSLLKAADLALFTAKRSGRNSVCGYSPLLLASSTLQVPFSGSQTSAGASDISLPTGADLETVQALITAIDLRDGYTAAHSDGVARYAVAIAQGLSLPTEQLEALRLGGLIHDVGKIGVPDDVLRKPGKLTDAEWVRMRAHTTMGESILLPVAQLHHLLPLVRWHHERLDGSGYPDGIAGDQIAVLVRILSVADVFEAFTAERPYHPARSFEEGLQLLQSEAQQGKLDQEIVRLFVHLINSNAFERSAWHDSHALLDVA